jgi:hypothetical protein
MGMEFHYGRAGLRRKGENAGFPVTNCRFAQSTCAAFFILTLCAKRVSMFDSPCCTGCLSANSLRENLE